MELSKLQLIQIRRFLNSDTGMAALLYLRENAPRVNRGDQFQMIFDSGVTEGYKQAIDRLSEFTPADQSEDANPDNPGLKI